MYVINIQLPILLEDFLFEILLLKQKQKKKTVSTGHTDFNNNTAYPDKRTASSLHRNLDGT